MKENRKVALKTCTIYDCNKPMTYKFLIFVHESPVVQFNCVLVESEDTPRHFAPICASVALLCFCGCFGVS